MIFINYILEIFLDTSTINGSKSPFLVLGRNLLTIRLKIYIRNYFNYV